MSLKRLSVLFVLAGTLSISGMASAAKPAYIGIKGLIRSGGACNLTLGNGGVIDFGKLSSAHLSNSIIRERRMSLTINCPGPTKIGFGVVDNRSDTLDPDSSSFGLGPAGSYSVILKDCRVDGKYASPSYRDRYGGKWDTYSGLFVRPRGDRYDYIYSWDRARAGWGVESQLIISPFWDHVAVTDELEINGSATLELVYL